MPAITSRHNPLVKRFRQVAEGEASDAILLDGLHLIDEAVRARLPLVTVAISTRGLALAGASALADDARRLGAEVHTTSDDVMDALSPVRTPSGIVALAKRPSFKLDDVFRTRPQLVVVGVDVQDPGNAGAIVRSAEAGGATGVVFAGASTDPFGWKALRGSMGSTLRLPVASGELQDVFNAAKAAGTRVIATVPRGGVSMTHADLKTGVALLLGGEGPGLAEGVTARADQMLTIPMRPRVESLNVAVAAAILVYEAARQRGSLAAS